MFTKSFAIAALAFSPAANAQEIRSAADGVVCLHSTSAVIQERAVERPLGAVPCPFSTSPQAGFSRAQEYAIVLGETRLCFWRFTAGPDPTGIVRLMVVPDGEVGSVLALGQSVVTIGNPVMNPCDIDLNGAFNVLDFMTFLNGPYDWNGDGTFNILDFHGLLNTCES